MTLIFPADPIAHRCVDVLEETFAPRPAPGSIATCCGKYFVLDERTGLWKRLPKWSRRVREALAHYDERQQR